MHTYDYKIITSGGFDKPIYVRDPITNIVTRHDAPYEALPRAQTTLNPALWSIKMANIVLSRHGARTYNKDYFRPLLTLSHVYDRRVPIPFLYHGGHSLGEFPERLQRYELWELGVPQLHTAPSRKRSRDDTESDDSSSASESDTPPSRPAVCKRRRSSPPTSASSSLVCWRNDVDCTNELASDDNTVALDSDEPVRQVAAVGSKAELRLQWTELKEGWQILLQRQMRDATDDQRRKTWRSYLARLQGDR